MIMQPLGLATNNAVRQWKGLICEVKEYNSYTGNATVWVESAKQTVDISGHCLFPRCGFF